jgi:hypothetical protein
MTPSKFCSAVTLTLSLVVLTICIAPILCAQQAAVVPTLVNFSGALNNASGKPFTGTVGVTFYLYKDQQGGSPLWMETQNVAFDKNGRYTVVLGSTTSQGLPTNLFASGEARWLGVQAQGQAEQPRVLLLSVPYALKAGDAQTVGGLSPSAFMLAVRPDSDSSTTSPSGSNSNSPPLGGTGTTNYLPIWTNSTTLGSSVLFQSGTGSKAKVGIGTTKPASTLDVKGGGTIRGLFSLPAIGTATTTAGFNSQPIDLAASAFNTGTSTAVAQTFQWQAEPVGNNTSSATGSLNLLFAQGTGKAKETGLNIASNGQITFAPGQTFPGTGNGTITGVKAGTDLTGGGNSGNVTLNVDTTKVVTGVNAGTDLTGGGTGGALTLNLDTTKVPQLSVANTFTGNQTINGNLIDSGNISATGSITGQTGAFSANNPTQVLSVTQSGTGAAANLSSSSNSQTLNVSQTGTGPAIMANGGGAGVFAVANAAGGSGVIGVGNANQTLGVQGYTTTSNGSGVGGFASGNQAVGVHGNWSTPSGIGYGTAATGVWGDSANGNAVVGTSDTNHGVFGMTDSGVGVDGISNSYVGVAGASSTNVGVYGITSNSSVAGVEGVYLDTISGTGLGSTQISVWGDTGVSGAVGVLGTTDDGNSLFGVNNTVNHETLYVQNSSGFNGGTPLAARFAGPGSSTYCYIPRDSADNGTGDIVCTGTKSAAVPLEGNRMVRLYTVEAADNWFEDAGSGQLSNGSVAIHFEPAFSQTINPSVEYHIFLTPKGDCEGLYVSNENVDGFEVHELRRGHSNIAFDYRIMARRKGFENVRMQDVTQDFANMKHESDLLAARVEARKQYEKTQPKREHPQLPKPAPSSGPSATHQPTLPMTVSRLNGSAK